MFEKWGKGIEPVEYITKDEVQDMIDTAIRRHNRNAGMISMFVGFFVLGLFSDCLLYTSPSPRDRQKSRMPSSA